MPACKTLFTLVAMFWQHPNGFNRVVAQPR
jgi:hypothetical protein